MRLMQRCAQSIYAPLIHPRRAFQGKLPSLLPLPTCRRALHATARLRVVDLAYRLHDDKGNAKGDPIVMVHGLFGSKRNKQSVAKYIAYRLRS